MNTTNKALAITIVLLLLSTCAAPPAAPKDAPSGKWSGTYELASDRNEPIGVDLRWESTNLVGTVRAGARSMPVTKASFTPETGAITMEFDAEGNGGRTIHYTINGKVTGNAMTGTWTHDDQHGDFRVTKQ